MMILLLVLLASVATFTVVILRQHNVAHERQGEMQTRLTLLQAKLDAAKENEKSLLAQIDQERALNERLRQKDREQWDQQFALLQEKLKTLASEQLARRQQDLQEANKAQLGLLLDPVKAQFELFQRTLADVDRRSAQQKTELQTTFEKTMKAFAQEQTRAVEKMQAQSSQIASEASNLTRVLRSDTRTQGGWGEMVLENILESSGLREGHEFFKQKNIATDPGGRNSLQPDVLVKLPGDRVVIIDSKVSLTNLQNAMNADNELMRKQNLAEHAKSVRRHVAELAKKDYASTVPDAIGYVLMFMPFENSYTAAVQQDNAIPYDAYRQHIIIITPSGLMMTMQLAYNLWQTDRQTKSTQEITEMARKLYEKTATFSKSFSDLDAALVRARTAFDSTSSLLFTGRGNMMRQIEELKKKGVTPGKSIIGLPDDDDDDEPEGARGTDPSLPR